MSKFENYQAQFKSETGLDPKTNIDAYIQYYQGQVLEDMLNEQKQQFKILEDVLREIRRHS